MRLSLCWAVTSNAWFPPLRLDSHSEDALVTEWDGTLSNPGESQGCVPSMISGDAPSGEKWGWSPVSTMDNTVSSLIASGRPGLLLANLFLYYNHLTNTVQEMDIISSAIEAGPRILRLSVANGPGLAWEAEVRIRDGGWGWAVIGSILVSLGWIPAETLIEQCQETVLGVRVVIWVVYRLHAGVKSIPNLSKSAAGGRWEMPEELKRTKKPNGHKVLPLWPHTGTEMVIRSAPFSHLLIEHSWSGRIIEIENRLVIAQVWEGAERWSQRPLGWNCSVSWLWWLSQETTQVIKLQKSIHIVKCR